MKDRKGKMLREYERERTNGEYRGVTITYGHTGRREVPGHQLSEAIGGDINSLLSDTIFFLEERFVKYFKEEPHSLFSVFNFKLWPDRNSGEQFKKFGEDQIERLINLYGPVLTEEDIENGLDQWLDLKFVISRTTKISVVDAYEQVLSTSHEDHERIKYMLPLVRIMLTISPSTAECERGFSAMNRIKTQSKTSMSQLTLQNLMRVTIDGPTHDPIDSVVLWLNSGTDKRHVDGHVCTGPRGKQVQEQHESDSD